jgi:hypothetical protein
VFGLALPVAVRLFCGTHDFPHYRRECDNPAIAELTLFDLQPSIKLTGQQPGPEFTPGARHGFAVSFTAATISRGTEIGRVSPPVLATHIADKDKSNASSAKTFGGSACRPRRIARRSSGAAETARYACSIPVDRLFKPDDQDDIVVSVHDFKLAVIWLPSSEHLR